LIKSKEETYQIFKTMNIPYHLQNIELYSNNFACVYMPSYTYGVIFSAYFNQKHSNLG